MFNQNFYQGKTVIQEAAGSFQIEKGVMYTKDIIGKTSFATLQTTGNIHLPHQMIDLKTQISLVKNKDFPPLFFYLKGPWVNMKKTIDFKPLKKYLLKKTAQKFLPSFKKKNTPSENKNGPAKKKENIIDNLLSGLSKNKTDKEENTGLND